MNHDTSRSVPRRGICRDWCSGRIQGGPACASAIDTVTRGAHTRITARLVRPIFCIPDWSPLISAMMSADGSIRRCARRSRIQLGEFFPSPIRSSAANRRSENTFPVPKFVQVAIMRVVYVAGLPRIIHSHRVVPVLGIDNDFEGTARTLVFASACSIDDVLPPRGRSPHRTSRVIQVSMQHSMDGGSARDGTRQATPFPYLRRSGA